jgi:hypothetical protein
MGLLTTLAVGLGAAGAIAGASQARKNRKSQEAEMARQDTLAREMGRLNMTKDGTGADIVLGTDFTKGGARNASTSRQTPGNAPLNPSSPNTGFKGENNPLSILMNQMMGIKQKRRVVTEPVGRPTNFAQAVMG